MKIPLGGFKAVLEKENICQPGTGNEILYMDSNESLLE
jgi:hypothetical protein